MQAFFVSGPQRFWSPFWSPLLESGLSRKLGMTISPYRFRHSFATELMAGDNAYTHLTQLLMGHSDIRSTMIYVDVPVDKLRSYLMQRSEA